MSVQSTYVCLSVYVCMSVHVKKSLKLSYALCNESRQSCMHVTRPYCSAFAILLMYIHTVCVKKHYHQFQFIPFSTNKTEQYHRPRVIKRDMLSKLCMGIAVKAPYMGSFASSQLHAPYRTVLFCSIPFSKNGTEW